MTEQEMPSPTKLEAMPQEELNFVLAEKARIEGSKIQLESGLLEKKTNAEIEKLLAEKNYIDRQRKFLPSTVATPVLAALSTLIIGYFTATFQLSSQVDEVRKREDVVRQREDSARQQMTKAETETMEAQKTKYTFEIRELKFKKGQAELEDQRDGLARTVESTRSELQQAQNELISTQNRLKAEQANLKAANERIDFINNEVESLRAQLGTSSTPAPSRKNGRGGQIIVSIYPASRFDYSAANTLRDHLKKRGYIAYAEVSEETSSRTKQARNPERLEIRTSDEDLSLGEIVRITSSELKSPQPRVRLNYLKSDSSSLPPNRSERNTYVEVWFGSRRY